MSARTRKDWLLLGALGCALVGTAHAEYTLAVAAHFNEYVALAVPGALDLYVLRALQQRRDVFVAVLAMVAANVTAHLLTAGVLHEHWAITSAAGALAPLILWRVYSLKHTRTREELLAGVPAGAMSAPAPEVGSHASGCGQMHPDDGRCTEYGAPRPWPDEVQMHLRDECGCQLQHNAAGEPVIDERCAEHTAPDHVPADWMDEEYPETHPSAPAPDEWVLRNGDPVPDWLASAPHPCPLSEPFLRPLDDKCSECGGRWGDHPGVQAKRAAHLLKYPEYEGPTEWDQVRTLASEVRTLVDGLGMPAPHLRSVPDLPAEYAPGAVHSETPLTDSDLVHLPGAQEYVDQTERPSVRGLKKALGIGQERAERLLTHLGVIL